jgi:hypothetical protein
MFRLKATTRLLKYALLKHKTVIVTVINKQFQNHGHQKKEAVVLSVRMVPGSNLGTLTNKLRLFMVSLSPSRQISVSALS